MGDEEKSRTFRRRVNIGAAIVAAVGVICLGLGGMFAAMDVEMACFGFLAAGIIIIVLDAVFAYAFNRQYRKMLARMNGGTEKETDYKKGYIVSKEEDERERAREEAEERVEEEYRKTHGGKENTDG